LIYQYTNSTNRDDKYLATPFKPEAKYGIASTAFAAIIATESDGVTKNLTIITQQTQKKY
jgi:hypothetical protein